MAAALLQTWLCSDLWRIPAATQALLIENKPRFLVMIVSVPSAFQQHFCSVTKGGWRARERVRECCPRQDSSKAPGTCPLSTTGQHLAQAVQPLSLSQPGKQDGRRSCQRDGLPHMAGFPWAMENKTLNPGVGMLTLAGSRVGTLGHIQACLLPSLTPTSPDGVALLLHSLRGLRPLPDSHLTPVKLLVRCFEV